MDERNCPRSAYLCVLSVTLNKDNRYLVLGMLILEQLEKCELEPNANCELY